MSLIELEGSLVLVLPRMKNGRTLLLEDPNEDSLVNSFLRSLDIDLDFIEAFEGDNRMKDLIQERMIFINPVKAGRAIAGKTKKWFEENRKRIKQWIVNEPAANEASKQRLMNSYADGTFNLEDLHVIIRKEEELLQMGNPKRRFHNSVEEIPMPGLELVETIEQRSEAPDEEREEEEKRGDKKQRVGFFNQFGNWLSLCNSI